MRITWRSEWPHWLLLAGMVGLAALTWPDAPERIPTHWNVYGEADGWGGKVEGLLLMPLLAFAGYGLLLILPRFDPNRANYRTFAGSYDIIRLGLLVVFAVIYGVMHLAIRGVPVDMGRLMPVLLGGLFVVIGNALGKIRPNWFVGIRTPWTLSSKLAWARTHRLGGRFFVVGGLVTALAGLVSPVAGFVALMVTALGTTLWTLIYSYRVWRDDPDRVPATGVRPAEEV